jgi:transcriptional regulator with GAF, ATPase, and Fis domain/tetratricopeptide (TPR) repeat protein
VQRAIPPDQSHVAAPARPKDGRQHEAIGDLHLAADNFSGAVESYGAALKEIGPHEPVERCRLLERMAIARSRKGDYDTALLTLREARDTARLLHDPRINARIAARMAYALFEQGHYRPARRYAVYAFAALRGSDDHLTVGHVSVTIGLCHTRLGRPAEAIEWLQSAIATFRRIDDTDGLVTALNNLGLVHKNLREWREATRFLEEALRIDERAGLYARMLSHNQNLGLIRYRLGQWDLAEENFHQAHRIAVEVGHQQSEAATLLALGMLARRRRQLDRAGDSFHRAAALATQVGAQRERLLAQEYLGELELDRGNGAAALALFEPALADARGRAPEGDMAAELEIRTGLAMLAVARPDDAQAHLLRGLTIAERIGDRIEVAIAERGLAQLEATRGNVSGLEAHVRAAAQSFESLSEVFELALTLASWGDALLLLPTSTRLRVSLEPVAEAGRRAATLYRQLGLPARAAEAVLTQARLEAEREHYDQALALLETAEQWLAESSDPETEDRANGLRRDLERQYVAVSLSTCNEFRALEEANRLFRETSDMDGVLAQTVRLAVENAGGDRGFVAFSAGGARLDVVAQHGLGRERARRILRVIDGVVGNRIAESGPVFSSRVAADPRFSAALVEALEGVGSLVCVPLNFPSQSVGLVYVDRLNDNLLGAFRQRELNLLAVLANSAGVAIVEAQRSLLLEENRQLRDKLKPSPGSERIVTQSREMASIMSLLAKVGDSSATVLFMGETGTGKGLLAHVVHEMSNRRDHPFVQVNCAALPESLLESELFGHVLGAFTGATRDKTGLFEEAEGGTIFLDEIEKVPESVQAKLLHVLDRSEIRPVGATRPKRVDARVICATCVDLRERIREGRFLEDLYYRLNDITVRVPALRDRREDIPMLAQHFLGHYARQMEKSLRGFAPDVLRCFLDHEWRGNVRELEKTVKRMVVLADDGDLLGRDLLPPELQEQPAAEAASAADRDGRTLRTSVSQLERKLIAEALEKNRWNKAKVARELGLSYPTLLSRIRTLRIERRRAAH